MHFRVAGNKWIFFCNMSNVTLDGGTSFDLS